MEAKTEHISGHLVLDRAFRYLDAQAVSQCYAVCQHWSLLLLHEIGTEEIWRPLNQLVWPSATAKLANASARGVAGGSVGGEVGQTLPPVDWRDRYRDQTRHDALWLAPCHAPTARVMNGHEDWVAACVELNSATGELASASYDGTVRIWDKQGDPIDVIPITFCALCAMDADEEGLRIVTGSEDGTVQMMVRDSKADFFQVGTLPLILLLLLL